MKNTMVYRAMKTAFRTCPTDCIIMFIVQFLIVSIPIGGLYVLRWLIDSLMDKSNSFFSIPIVCYCFLIWAQKALPDWYHHYYLLYYSLLKFEKKIKVYFFQICLLMRLDDYNDAEFVNHSLRAKNASVNILRLYQAVIEMICAFLSVFVMGVAVSSINSNLIIIFVIMSLTEILDNIFVLWQNKTILYKNTQLEKEEAEISDLIFRANSLKEIVVFHCYEYIIEKWKNVVFELVKNEKSKDFKIFIFSLFMKIIYCVGTIFAYVFLFVSFTTSKIGLSSFSVSISAIIMLKGIFSGLFDTVANVSQFAAMVKPFYEYVDIVQNRKDINTIENTIDGAIHLKDVCYKYHNSEKNAVKNIDLTIEDGKKYVIVGENGSGKTTLMKLLMGLFKPSEGKISYGGVAQKVFNKQTLYKSFSSVSQNYNIYAISVKDNITFLNPSSELDICEAFEAMNLHELNDKLDNKVGRDFDGIELSGGQNQKIAILRAENKNGRIFFLDEPTSAIDPLQEKKIFDRIQKVANGRTTIIISHRLSLCRSVDMVIVMANGEIVEMGSHDELMSKQGIYWDMYKEQMQLYQI